MSLIKDYSDTFFSKFGHSNKGMIVFLRWLYNNKSLMNNKEFADFKALDIHLYMIGQNNGPFWKLNEEQKKLYSLLRSAEHKELYLLNLASSSDRAH